MEKESFWQMVLESLDTLMRKSDSQFLYHTIQKKKINFKISHRSKCVKFLEGHMGEYVVKKQTFLKTKKVLSIPF